MRRILFLAAAAVMAGLGAVDPSGTANRSHAAEPGPLTLGPAELHSIAVRRSPQRAASRGAAAVEATEPPPAEPAPLDPELVPTALAPEPALRAEPARPAGEAPVVTETDATAAAPAAVLLAPEELQAIGPRQRPTRLMGEATALPPGSSLGHGAHPCPHRRPESGAVATESSAAADQTLIVLAPAELRAVGPRAKPKIPVAPSPQPRPTRLVLAPARPDPPVLVPAEPATTIEIVEPSAGLPTIRADDGPGTLDDLGLQAIGIRVDASR